MFCFVSHEAETLTPELEKQITDLNAWAHVVPAGNIKPATNAGAFVLQSYAELNTKVNILETELKKEKQKREESDLVLANQISQINNILTEKDIITRDKERINQAHKLGHVVSELLHTWRITAVIRTEHTRTRCSWPVVGPPRLHGGFFFKG